MDLSFCLSNDEKIYTVTSHEGYDSTGIKYTLPLLTFNSLDAIPFIRHCFTTRLGGRSEGIFSSLNLSSSRGDNAEYVKENYKRIASALKCSTNDFIFSKQTHTTNVMRIKKDTIANTMANPCVCDNVDGLITDVPGIVLTTFYADCVPLYFVDPVHKAIGLSHSGWRGTVNRMGSVTLEKMKEEFGTLPDRVICAIGPSICGNCYEVGEDVANNFQQEFSSTPLLEVILEEKNNGKYLLNLWEANRAVLLDAGVPAKNIVVGNICTCCNSNILFSHRASQGKRGNLGAFLGIKPDITKDI